MSQYEEKPEVAEEDARQRHLEDDLRTLFHDGVALAKAEVELQQARAGYAAGKLKRIAVLGGVAFILAFFALVALTVGLVIGLTPLLGAIGATSAVFGGLVIIAAMAGLTARRQWRSMTVALSNKGSE